MGFIRGEYGALPVEKESRVGKRHWLILLGFFGCFNIYTIRICLSIAIVAMVAPPTSVDVNAFPHYNGNTSIQTSNETNQSEISADTCPEPEGFPQTGIVKANISTGKLSPQFEWDTKTQGLILGSYFYGYIFTQLAGGWLARRYGGKHPMGLGIFIAGILTLLTPVAANVHYGLLIALRVAEGLASGFCYPALNQLISRWSPAAERTRASAIVNAGNPAGMIVVLAVSGYLGDSFGWESIYYVFGGISSLWFVCWQLFVYNSPEDHPTIREAERRLISGSPSNTTTACELDTDELNEQKPPEIPWKSIFTSSAVWAMVFSHIGQNWGNYTLLAQLPTYLKNILKFNLSSNGVFSALPYLVFGVFSITSGYVSDHLRQRKLMSTTNVRKLFNTLGNAVPAVALIAMGYAGCDWVAAVALLTLATGFSGMTSSSFQVNALDLSPTFASIIFGFSNTISNLPGFISPYVVGVITAGPSGQSLFNWKIVFFISGGIRVVTLVVYAIWGSGEVATWNQGKKK
ncbi:Sialin [Hypsibius exemplaris]|uniref:Sialin n=1 Tax=Hypsibius exemplaris TaxID=2072580 RepID=A0A1W0XAI6_HYPEX|nr:Sialin [Hypsibius exemplaris]